MIEVEEIKENHSDTAPSRVMVWKLFDRISHRYDLLNRLLSFYQDVRWRKKVVDHLKNSPAQTVLDIATGTGDLLITLCSNSGNIRNGIGIDMARKMMEIGRKKTKKMKLNNKTSLLPGDAEHIPFRNNTFDAVTIAFGIRNLLDVNSGLVEMMRVLKPGGRSIILEFSLPENSLMKKMYLFYFRYILPKAGALISGDSYAYNYLNRTVETFPYGEKFNPLMKEAGFINLKSKPLTFGVATIYTGDKPDLN
ncbi:bifunctional demethylmenaquinone methyltransferase/2-methoxy-6-polyprenyl-1,4-benzoquinol methylase UbiE [candidate division KSB1 bacterium]